MCLQGKTVKNKNNKLDDLRQFLSETLLSWSNRYRRREFLTLTACLTVPWSPRWHEILATSVCFSRGACVCTCRQNHVSVVSPIPVQQSGRGNGSIYKSSSTFVCACYSIHATSHVRHFRICLFQYLRRFLFSDTSFYKQKHSFQCRTYDLMVRFIFKDNKILDQRNLAFCILSYHFHTASHFKSQENFKKNTNGRYKILLEKKN